jgi:hypothetical protein
MPLFLGNPGGFSLEIGAVKDRNARSCDNTPIQFSSPDPKPVYKIESSDGNLQEKERELSGAYLCSTKYN